MNDKQEIMGHEAVNISHGYLWFISILLLAMPVVLWVIAMIERMTAPAIIGAIFMFSFLLVIYTIIIPFLTKYQLTHSGVQTISFSKPIARRFSWEEIEAVYEILICTNSAYGTNYFAEYLAFFQKGQDYKYILSYTHKEQLNRTLKEKGLIVIPKTEEAVKFVEQYKPIQRMGE